MFYTPNEEKYLKTGWLAYPVIIKNPKIKRKNLQIFLEKRGVQTRTIFTGNILRQPIMKNIPYKKIKNADNNSNFIMENGMLIGCHHGLVKKDLDYIIYIFKNFISNL